MRSLPKTTTPTLDVTPPVPPNIGTRADAQRTAKPSQHPAATGTGPTTRERDLLAGEHVHHRGREPSEPVPSVPLLLRDRVIQRDLVNGVPLEAALEYPQLPFRTAQPHEGFFPSW